jgi:hypothetical protein
MIDGKKYLAQVKLKRALVVNHVVTTGQTYTLDALVEFVLGILNLFSF